MKDLISSGPIRPAENIKVNALFHSSKNVALTRLIAEMWERNKASKMIR